MASICAGLTDDSAGILTFAFFMGWYEAQGSKCNGSNSIPVDAFATDCG